MSAAADGAAVRVPPPLVYLCATLIGWLLQAYALPLALGFELWFRIGATVVLGALAVVIMAGAVKLFRKTAQDPKPWKPTPEILVAGVYRFTRNPMYVSMALVQVSIGVALQNGWIVVLIAPTLMVVHYTAIRPEEVYLERKFGETYLEYKRAVRRWI